jgi:hypothetical protein
MPAAAPVKQRWRDTWWGFILLSYDFYVGVPLGFALGILPALSKDASGMATTVLVSFGGALIAIAAVVVAALTIFATVLSPEYLIVIQRREGGVKRAVRPFAIVGWVCIVGALCSFAAALGWPAIPPHSWWISWLAFSVPAALTAWGLLGTAQLVGLGSFHMNQRSELLRAVTEVRRRNQSRSA